MNDIEKILPETVLQLMVQLSAKEGEVDWAYGDIVNLVYDYIVANDVPYTKEDAARFVSWYCNSDKAVRTLLYYASTALHFPPEIREAYGVLPFSHFNYAARFGEHWREVLDYSLDAFEKYNRPPSLSRLMQNFEPARISNQQPGLPEDFHSYQELDYQPAETARTIVSDRENDLAPVVVEVQRIVARLNILLPRLQTHAPNLVKSIAQLLLTVSSAISMIDLTSEIE